MLSIRGTNLALGGVHALGPPPPRPMPIHTTMNLLSANASARSAQTQGATTYALRLASDSVDVQGAQALRFEVFNLELDEGLTESYDTGLDVDPFDAVCDHLVVHDLANGRVVGTYRLQTGLRARDALGYYSAQEFDFSPFEVMRSQTIELGRACIHANHRNFAVLNLLWKGIASYAQQHGARYLLGCSSLTSQDEAVGAAAYTRLGQHLAPPGWRTRPLPAFECRLDVKSLQVPHIPRLLSAYLALGASICGPPAIDREFRTIDFLTWLDLESPALKALRKRGRFLA